MTEPLIGLYKDSDGNFTVRTAPCMNDFTAMAPGQVRETVEAMLMLCPLLARWDAQHPLKPRTTAEIGGPT